VLEGGCACFRRTRYNTSIAASTTIPTAAATPTPALASAVRPLEDAPLDTGGELEELEGGEVDEVEVVVAAVDGEEVEGIVPGLPIFHPMRATALTVVTCSTVRA
jgi:hypothetical protein